MKNDPLDVDNALDEIDRDVLAAMDASVSAEAVWAEWARELAIAMIARDCAHRLKSARQEALREMAERINDAADDDDGFDASPGVVPAQGLHRGQR